MKLKWLTIGLPLVICVTILGLMINGTLKDPRFDLRLNGEVLVLLVGLLLSALLTVNFATQGWLAFLHRHSLAHAREETAEEHRRFLNRLDHEIKNPLTAILAALANLKGTTDKGAREQIVASIDVQVLRLSNLVSDLRKVADLGTRPLECSPISASDLVEEAAAMAADDPIAQGRSIRLGLPEPDCLVYGDRDLLLLALNNLVNNALKFTCRDSKVDIGAFREGAVLVLQVVDDGPGIPPPELLHVWKELYRGQAAQGIAGSGIGMALVQAIVERHQGTVSIRSEVGKETVVSLRLPLAPLNGSISTIPERH